MPIHYCDTIYESDPITDINPLLLRRYKKENILVICTRDGMVTRINDRMAEFEEAYPDQSLNVIGIWELEPSFVETGFVDLDFVFDHYVIIIVGKDRVHKRYEPIIEQIESACIK